MNAKTQAAVMKHGEQLKAVFGLGVDVDPVGLCRMLRRLEREGAAIGLRLCNGPEYPEGEAEWQADCLLTRVNSVLGFRASGVPVILNLDPRGYALKIESEWMQAAKGRDEFYDTPVRQLHRDMGGYGIIAPDLTDK